MRALIAVAALASTRHYTFCCRTPSSSSTDFVATAVEVVTAAPPSTLSYQKGFVPKVAVKADLSVLVLRPRLGGAKCAAPYRTSNSSEEV